MISAERAARVLNSALAPGETPYTVEEAAAVNDFLAALARHVTPPQSPAVHAEAPSERPAVAALSCPVETGQARRDRAPRRHTAAAGRA